MANNDIIRIINEEISEFDFLGNREHLKEQENIDLMKNEDFQKQFIIDSILKKREKIVEKVSDAIVGSKWEVNNEDYLNIEYSSDITYTYDTEKSPIEFALMLSGDKVYFKKGTHSNAGSYDTAPYHEEWFDDIGWNDIDANLYTKDGDEINFTAFKNANYKIKGIFVREYLEDTIVQKSLEIREPKERM
jgi:hypothetical protein